MNNRSRFYFILSFIFCVHVIDCQYVRKQEPTVSTDPKSNMNHTLHMSTSSSSGFGHMRQKKNNHTKIKAQAEKAQKLEQAKPNTGDSPIKKEKQQDDETTAKENVRLQRERAFENELARMTKEQQKTAQRQEKKDARIVRRVLRAFSNHNNLYQVLALQSLEITIPPVRVLNKTISNQITVLHIPTKKAIQRAYRKRATQVHPDKNRDGRAVEAFRVVNEAASILLDDQLRKEYDLERKMERQVRIRRKFQIAQDILNRFFGVISATIRTMRKLLGPFFAPILILGSLMI